MANNTKGYTIVDIMRGVHELELYLIIPPAPFTFFMGLICKANALRFKEEISLTIEQATHLGGGKSRQAVNRNRKILCGIKIDDEPLLRVKAGHRQKNVAAKYAINYKKLVQYASSWSGVTNGFDGYQSNVCDSNGTERGLFADCSRTILRSEKNRKENTPPEDISNVISNSNPLEKLLGECVSGFYNLLDSEQADQELRKQALAACQDAKIMTRRFFKPPELPLQYIIDSIEDAKANNIINPGHIVNLMESDSRLNKWITSRRREFDGGNHE